MLQIEALSPAELAQHHRAIRNEDRAYARAKETAAADPYQTYRCCKCCETDTALSVAWWGRDCSCGGVLIGQPTVQLRNPITGPVAVQLIAGPR